ncbi:nuclear transport factor 2 family protein [Lactiplantibacillus sp. DA1]|uniref:nuclear transport factor 2 family protein n=1 Tax=Lactiplantibacillus sp. DA1 TaxID=3079857 RepID=UPI00292A62FD|nr:nuclear transport factor 2 family protein [Lactiplantibacillus sp. DA1]MDV0430527.1 nuclear transport factor 2 family protein [Lactiplantibacillus sp. DA1]
MTDGEAIVQLYRDENEAMVNKDLNKLNEILTDDMHLTHMTGYVQPKFEWIDQIQNEEMQYLASKEEAIKAIQINGDKASLIGQNRVQAKIWGGGINTWPLQMQMYYKKQVGKWMITDQVASTY